jgi:uncharacterized protein YceK
MNKFKSSIFLVVLTIVILFAGCSSASNRKSTAQAPTNQAQNEVAGVTDQKSTATATKNVLQTSRKIQKSASLNVETLTYEKSISKLESLVDQSGGYVESSTTEGQGLKSTDTARIASYTIRIPSEKLNEFLNSFGSIGNVTSKSIKGEDVTQSYFDTQSRLTALRIQQTSLQDMLKKSGNLADLIQINNSLTDVNTQIEQLTSQLQAMDSLVSLSKVDVKINEVAKITKVEKPDDSFGAQLLGVITSSLTVLIIAVQVIVKIIVAVLPFVIVFGGITLIIIYLIKFLNKRKRK